MLEKLNRILSIALILTIIGVGTLWIIFREQVMPRTLLTKFSKEQKVSQRTSTASSTEEELVTPDSQKMLKVSENRESQDLGTAEPNSMNGMSQFLKSQGVELDELDYGEYLNVFTKMFQDQFPGEHAATLEPHMRERLATLAGEMNITLESGLPQEDFFEDVMVKFLIEEQNIPWMMTYFEGDFFEAARWARDILQNPIPPSTEAFDTLTTDGLPTFSEQERLGITSDQPTESTADRNPLSNSVSPAAEGPRAAIENDVDVDPGLTPTSSELPTEEYLENALGERFSSDRFNRAMQTLDQHGPEEGLRRLKDSDPEIAKQLERFIQKKQEEN